MDGKRHTQRRVAGPAALEPLEPRVLLSGDSSSVPGGDDPFASGPGPVSSVVAAEWIKTDWKDIGWSSSDYVDWKLDNDFTASQYWALPDSTTAGYGRPYGAEIQTARGYDDAWYVQRLQTNAQNPNFRWITFECEVPWTSRSEEVLQLVRQHAPNVEIWGGPFGGWDSAEPVGFDEYDALICFYNVGRADRMGEDFAYILAQGRYLGKPMLLMPQPVDAGAGEPPPVTDPDAYAAAIEIASYGELGVGMWYSDRLWPYPDSPERTAVLDAWASAEQKPLPPTTILIPVDGNWRPNRALARVLWHAGYVSEGYDSSEGIPPGQEYRTVTWDDLAPFKPAGYDTQLTYFYDLGHPQRQPDQKEIVRAMELAMADDLRALLVSRGIDPIEPANHAPFSRDDGYGVARNAVLTAGPEEGVLANDADVDGDALTVTLTAGPAHGALSLEADGSFVYLPELGYVGPDSFTYTAADGHGGTDTAEAAILVALDQQPTTAEVAAHWALDDGAGVVAADSGPHDYDGLLEGFSDPDAAWRTDSASGGGGSLHFGGGEQVLVDDAAAPLLSPVEQITVSAWIQPDALATRTVAAKWQTYADRRSYWLQTAYESWNGRSYVSFSISHDGADEALCRVRVDDRGYDLADGQWHHLAGTFDGADLKVYVDGALIHTINAPGPIADTSADFYIGRDRQSDRWWLGGIDDVQVYPVALDAEAVAWLHAHPDSALPAPVRGDLDGDGEVGAADISILLREARAGTHYPARDLTGDGAVTAADADEWVYRIKGTAYGDANLDGRVDVFDLALLGASYGRPAPRLWQDGDSNGDGVVDVFDLGILANSYVAGTGGMSAAGEPSAASPPERSPSAPALREGSTTRFASAPTRQDGLQANIRRSAPPTAPADGRGVRALPIHPGPAIDAPDAGADPLASLNAAAGPSPAVGRARSAAKGPPVELPTGPDVAAELTLDTAIRPMSLDVIAAGSER